MKFVLGLIAALTLSAPALAQSSNQDLLNMYQGYEGDTQTDLQKAHRSIREMEEWTSDVVAEVLLFDKGKTNTKLASAKQYFSEAGYKSYLTFLGNQPYAAQLRAQTLAMVTIVTNTPMLIGQGASGGRYAWAFEMPITMTTNGVTSEPVTLRLQIGRAANAPAPGVLIENWQVFNEPVQNTPVAP